MELTMDRYTDFYWSSVNYRWLTYDLPTRLAKRARNLRNVAHLVKCRAFDQLVKCAAHSAKCADWSNVSYYELTISINC